MSAPPINTHVRLFDLVRYMRAELHDKDLITDEEYAWLCAEATMANDPKGGSPSPRRLEDYDKLRADLAALRADAAILCGIIDHANPGAWSNGNTFPDGHGSDEGEVMMSNIYSPLRAKYVRAPVATNPTS